MVEFTDLDAYNDLVQSFGPPAHRRFPAEEQLAHWRPRVPELLLRYWAEEGWGSLSKGQYWVCDPDYLRPVLEEVFAGDPEYNVDDLIPFGYNALGMIDAAMGEGRSMTIDLGFGTVTWRGPQAEFPQSEFMGVYYSRISTGAHRLDWNDEDGIPLFPWALENLGELAPGEIYGFVPAYSASGDYPVRNLQKLPLIEHLVMLASLSPPTLYDYVQPEGEQGGFGTLVPIRKVGQQL
ncbi:GAD-like domain-containing protein [uncultured Paracoccus sp.]|uniref:GAD-like domain-containing protein n=1 Tax=uncultured Paracoccus sp. TaxID=189685 RepID=UPI0025916D9A|nr:GAD-like domain-containing protein [uncultured Paracoccus sp.]